MADTSNPGVTLTPVKGCLVATLHADIHEHSLEHIRTATLEGASRIQAKAVIFDLSALRLLDQHEFGQLQGTAVMLRLLGCRTVLVGLSAGLVAYLVTNDVNTSGLETERGLEDALDRLIPWRLAGHV